MWPFAVRKSSGYGAYDAHGKNCDVHRYVCTIVHGNPDDGMQAAHRCGNKLCVNPKHLYWADPLTNMADAKAHGTLRGGGRYRQKLFDKEITEILNSSESLLSLGDRFGMDPAYIGKLRRKHLSMGVRGNLAALIC